MLIIFSIWLIRLALTIDNTDKNLEMHQYGLKFNRIYVAMHCFLVYSVFKDWYIALVAYIWSCSDGRCASRSQLTRNWWWYVSSLTSARMHSRMSWSLLFLNYIFLVNTFLTIINNGGIGGSFAHYHHTSDYNVESGY